MCKGTIGKELARISKLIGDVGMEIKKEYSSLQMEIVYVCEDVIKTSNGGGWPWSGVEDENDFGQ